MANESIRLPSDSTVASQKVHRGSGLPETQLLQTNAKPSAPPTPLLTVVLQSQALVEGKKGQLFELLLQNDPKSEPPVRVLADTQIKPGTSLLLELNPQGQYQPVAKPDAAQLVKLIMLELDFWRSQLIPKAGSQESLKVPDLKTLELLSQVQPQLKPLVQWLAQRPTHISASLVARWFQEASPLQPFRPAMSETPADKLLWALNSSSSATSTPAIAHPARSAGALQALLAQPTLVKSWLAGSILSPAVTANTVQTFLRSVASTINASAPPTANSAPAPVTAQTTVSNSNNTNIVIGDRNSAVTTPFRFLGSLTASITTGQATTESVSTVSVPSRVSPGAPTVQASQSFSNPGASSEMAARPTQPAVSASINANESVASGALINTLANHTGKGEQSQHHLSLPPIPTSTKAADTATLGRLPLEVRLSQWIQVIDQLIQRTPQALTSKLSAEAADLLRQLVADTGGKIMNSHAQNPQISTEDEPLLQLRNWLENQQVRMQTMAVQTASNHWQSAEQPTIQQMQLPLIWLGLTGWADIEWWQQPRSPKDGTHKKKRQSRRWRMKIYLNMQPLAPMCADLNWSEEFTRLTFWSEDSNTLNHLNRLLPTLDAWTNGLGDKQLQTKYGMPKKASEQPTNETQHLVDVRT